MKQTTSKSIKLLLCILSLFTAHSAHTQIILQENPAVAKVDDCILLTATFKKQNDGKTPCCYQITLNNQLPSHTNLFPSGFQVSVRNGNITDAYAMQNTWQQTPKTVPAKTKTIAWNQQQVLPSGQLPVATICVEGKNPIWLSYAWLDRTGKVLCRDSIQLADCVNEPTDLCDKPLIQNGEFTPKNGATAFWTKGYGNPKFLDTPGEGCFDPGYVEASGNQNTGDAVSQALAPINKILKGKKYLLSVGVRFFANKNTLDYARIRAIAYNGPLPATGLHPAPSPNITIIGRSGKIRDCGDWSVIEFPVWVANKDFQNIAINVFTNDGTVAKLWIDNVTLCETSWGGDCDEVQYSAAGKPVPPPGYGQVPPGFACQPEAEDDAYNNGSLQDLYGQLYGFDGTTNWYSKAGDKCFSVGGTLPPEVVNYNCGDSLRLAGLNMTCEELQNRVADPNVDDFTIDKMPYLPPIGDITNDCTNPPSLPDVGNWAFKGKDIIYIHGLQLDHVKDRIIGIKPGAMANWPGQPNEFYGTGYYKASADSNWVNHITYFTKNKNYLNRYLVVSYNCSQRLEVAVNCVLAQIREAMEHEKGVVADSRDPRGTKCFGREYVIISQSTGAIVTDVLLAIAAKTKTDPVMAAKYGNISLIADRCKGHIARRGAFTGSDLATILVVLAVPTPRAAAIATGIMLQDGEPFVNFANPASSSIIRSSILVDLIPKIARTKWAPYYDQVPVPVLTVSGGHPSFLSQQNLAAGGALFAAAPAIAQIMGLPIGTGPVLASTIATIMAAALSFKYIVHPGFDDGVITTDCANGRKSTFFTPSTFHATSPIKAFDMGIPKVRAACYYLDQRRLQSISTFAAGASPYLSPTGMVEPVSYYSLNQSYRNHFSFMQAAAEHWIKKNKTSCCNYNSTAIGGSTNYEEELVVSNAALFNPATGIIDPAIIPEMAEEIRGRYILYPYIKFRWSKGIYRPFVFWRKFYIWKRTYHKMGDNGLFDCDYIYRYLFKN